MTTTSPLVPSSVASITLIVLSDPLIHAGPPYLIIAVATLSAQPSDEPQYSQSLSHLNPTSRPSPNHPSLPADPTHTPRRWGSPLMSAMSLRHSTDCRAVKYFERHDLGC